MGRSILFVHGLSAIGGAERDLLGLLKRLDRRAWQPAVACPASGPFRAAVESLGVPVVPLVLPPWRKLSSLVGRYRGVWQVRELLLRLTPALIHVNDLWWVPHTVRAVVRLPYRLPLIAHVRQEAQPKKVRQYGLDRADHVVAVSHHVEKALASGGVSRQRLSTVYSGIDLSVLVPSGKAAAVRIECGIPADAMVLGTVANLLPLKGYDIMLAALPSILAACPTVHYMIVGAGEADYAARLRAMAVERGIVERVHFVGFQTTIVPYLEAMDLYVHPTLKEAFGLAVIEAMAMGKAVVASATGGLPEIVAQGGTGLLAPPGDVGQLSAAVVSLLRDPARCRQMGERGQVIVRKRFNLDASVAWVEQLYDRVLADGASKRNR